MAGVTGPGAADEKDKKEMLPVTPLGRYLKVLHELVGVPVRRLRRADGSGRSYAKILISSSEPSCLVTRESVSRVVINCK